MAKDSNKLKYLYDLMDSQTELKMNDYYLKITVPQILMEFIELTPDLEDDEMKDFLASIGYLIYKIIVDNKKKTWNLNDSRN